MQSVRIQTAQNVDIEYEVASVGERILAAMIDYIIQFAYSFAVIYPYWRYSELLGKLAWPYIIILIVLPLLLYDLLCELFMGGQSFGKKALRIKVVKLDGSQPSVGSYLLRWVLRLVDVTLFTGTVALITILINGRGQRIGDIAAGTAVIRMRQSVKMSDTIFVPLDEAYRPAYDGAGKLTDRVITVIREALDFAEKNPRSRSGREVLAKAAGMVADKLGIATPADHRELLVTVLKDYNYYHGKV